MAKIKRVYDKKGKDDGFRILVDRLWPRGMSKEKAQVDFWLKEIAPSNKLRKWFDHDPEKWPEFQNRFKKELNENKDSVDILKKKIKENKNVTLVYAAKDKEHNNAVFLRDYLNKKI